MAWTRRPIFDENRRRSLTIFYIRVTIIKSYSADGFYRFIMATTVLQEPRFSKTQPLTIIICMYKKSSRCVFNRRRVVGNVALIALVDRTHIHDGDSITRRRKQIIKICPRRKSYPADAKTTRVRRDGSGRYARVNGHASISHEISTTGQNIECRHFRNAIDAAKLGSRTEIRFNHQKKQKMMFRSIFTSVLLCSAISYSCIVHTRGASRVFRFITPLDTRYRR